MKCSVEHSTLCSLSQRQVICQPLRRKCAAGCLTRNIPPQRHTGIAEEGKTQPSCAPGTRAVTPPKLPRENDFPVHWAQLCSLTIGDLPQQMHQTSFSRSLLSQRQVVYWEVHPSCWVTATPAQSLPDFQSFLLISPALNFPVSSKKTQAVFVSWFQTGRREENQKAINCTMLLCWIDNTKKKTATIF